MRGWAGAAALAVSIAAGAAEAEEWEACLSGLRAAAVADGLDRDKVAVATAGIASDPSVLRLRANQPEVKTSTADYLTILVDAERIADGLRLGAEWKSALDEVERQFAVDRHIVTAIWGVESDYGRLMGRRDVLSSLATLVCGGVRVGYFRREFVLAVRIVATGKARRADMTGSWAGAFGQTQFMPSNFVEDAVDLDRDGTIDLVHSVPDALGSAASELRHSGWAPGDRWGHEVTVPKGFDGSGIGRKAKRPYGEWARLGVKRADGGALPASGTAGLILPAGPEGPGFLVTRNFDALYAYNASESYALAIGHLADWLAGGGPFHTPWPVKDLALTRAEIRELQAGLIRLGFDIGAIDGVAGDKTKEAVAAFAAARGLATGGRVSRSVLEAVKATL